MYDCIYLRVESQKRMSRCKGKIIRKTAQVVIQSPSQGNDKDNVTVERLHGSSRGRYGSVEEQCNNHSTSHCSVFTE